MTEAASNEVEFKEEDRVRRKGKAGSLGTVLEVRQELTSTSSDTTKRSILIKVHWDSGTVSYFGPEGLELSK